MANPYKIISDSDQVMVWSSRRLPFEPKGWLVSLRRDIRDAVRILNCGDDLVLDGTFISLDTDTFDVENILFYNVGVGCFKDSARHGIRFQRAWSNPPTYPNKGGQLTHYQRYTLTRRDGSFSEWLKGEILARWDRISLETGSLPELGSIWSSMRSSKKIINTADKIADHEFGLTVVIHPPHPGIRFNLTSTIKRVFDGVLSSFHQHSGPAQKVATILAGRMSIQPDRILEQLADESENLLGTRRLVWPRADGVQWNPADDRCVAGELLVGSLSSDQRRYKISGELFKVLKRKKTVTI